MESILLGVPVKEKSNEIRKSTKFDGAYILPGRKGHYFLNDNKQLENGKIAVQFVFYRGKWRQDTAWFSKSVFDTFVSQM